MLPGGREQLLVTAECERDAVGDLEAGLLAGLLDGADDLAGQALASQLVVEVQLQGDGVAGLGLHLVALELFHHEVDVVRRQGVVLAVDLDADLLAALERMRRPPRRRGPPPRRPTCGISLPKRGPSER